MKTLLHAAALAAFLLVTAVYAQANPTVTSVTAAVGSSSGNELVTIAGTGFVATPSVTFGGSAATSVTFINSTSITCVTPAHSIGAVTVTVTNPDTTSGSLPNGFTFRNSSPVCVINDTVFNPDNTVAVNQLFRLGQVLLNGRSIAQGPYYYVTDTNGVIWNAVVTPASNGCSGLTLGGSCYSQGSTQGIIIQQGATALIYSTIPPWNQSTLGVNIPVPASPTAVLSALATVAVVPTGGLTVENGGVPLTALEGTINFGNGLSASQSSPGVAQVSLSTSGAVDFGSVVTSLQDGVEIQPYGSGAGQTGEIRFDELAANGSNYDGFKAPDSLSSNNVWTLPASDAAGFWASNGSHGLSIRTIATGDLPTGIPVSDLSADSITISPSGPLGGGGSVTLGNSVSITCSMCVATGQANVYGAFTQDFSAAFFKVPNAGGYAPTTDALFGFNTTTHQYVGSQSSAAVVFTTLGNQTTGTGGVLVEATGPTISGPTINGSLQGNLDFGAFAHLQDVPNAGTTGTTANSLAKLTGAPSTAVVAATTDTGGVVGVVVAGAGTTGNASIAISGEVPCNFDGATTAGDYVQISSTAGGDCHDVGSTYPTAGQVIGRVLSTHGGSGLYTIQLFGPEIEAAVSGGGGGGSVTSVGIALPTSVFSNGSPVTTSGNLTSTFVNQSPNTFFAGPSSGGSATPAFRALVGADLPLPSSSTLGGIESIAAVSHKVVNSISTTGVPGLVQLDFSDLTGTSSVTTLGNTTSGTGGTILEQGSPTINTPTISGAVGGNLDIGSHSEVQEIANAGTTGTTVNKLAKLTGAPSTAVIAATTDTSGQIGIVVGGAGTTGNAQIAIDGQCSCVFDNATTAGDYVQISSTTAGDCHDAGASYPTSGQVIGQVLSTNGGAGTYTVLLFGPDFIASSGGGGSPGGSGNAIQYKSGSSFAGSTNVSVDTSNGGNLVFASVSAPSSPTDGETWNDSTHNGLATFSSGITTYIPGLLGALASSTTVTNTTTQATLASVTLPANFFTAGKTLYAVICGKATSTTTSGSANLSFELNWNSAADISISPKASQTLSNEFFEVHIWFTVPSTGSSVTPFGIATFNDVTVTTNSTGTTTCVGTVNTTTSGTLTLTAGWSAASSSDQVTFTSAQLYALN